MVARYHPASSDLPASPASLRASLQESLYCDALVLRDEIASLPLPANGSAEDRLGVRCFKLALLARLTTVECALMEWRGQGAARRRPPRAHSVRPLPPQPGATSEMRRLFDQVQRIEDRLAACQHSDCGAVDHNPVHSLLAAARRNLSKS